MPFRTRWNSPEGGETEWLKNKYSEISAATGKLLGGEREKRESFLARKTRNTDDSISPDDRLSLENSMERPALNEPFESRISFRESNGSFGSTVFN